MAAEASLVESTLPEIGAGRAGKIAAQISYPRTCFASSLIS
jgi:hypothetical protein